MRELPAGVAIARTLTAAYPDAQAFRCAPASVRIIACGRRRAPRPARYWDADAIASRRAAWPSTRSMSQ